MSSSSASRRPSSLAIFGAGVSAAAAVWGGTYIAQGRDVSMEQRYDTSYGHGCLAGTAWGTGGRDLRSPGGVVLGMQDRLAAPRLIVTGTDSSGHDVALTFTARDLLRGHDPLLPVDAATAQVLHEHQCAP